MYELKFNTKKKRKDLLEDYINGGSFSVCAVFFHYWIVTGISLFSLSARL